MDTRTNDEPMTSRALVSLTPELAQRFRDPRAVLGVALVAAGAVALFAGYWGVSDTLDPGKQLPYIISGGIGGVFLLGAGVASFFSSQLAELRRTQAEVLDTVRDLRDELARAREKASAASANGRGRAPRTARTTT